MPRMRVPTAVLGGLRMPAAAARPSLGGIECVENDAGLRFGVGHAVVRPNRGRMTLRRCIGVTRVGMRRTDVVDSRCGTVETTAPRAQNGRAVLAPPATSHQPNTARSPVTTSATRRSYFPFIPVLTPN